MILNEFTSKNYDKLDNILVDLCALLMKGKRKDPDLGMVAAAVLDPDNNCVSAVNYPDKEGHRVHAERAAIDAYQEYAGYADPSQDEAHKQFNVITSTNPRIKSLCNAYADTFLKDELNELSFLGSECTKDCSGHRAGYDWSKRKGLKQGNSPWSPSFNKGAALAVAGK